MMDADASQLPLIVFDEATDEPKTFSSGPNEDQGPSSSSASLSEEKVCQATVSVCGGQGSQGYLEMESTGHGEAASGSDRKTEQGKDLDASGMEDMIQKILEKYGEAEEQGGSAVQPRRTSSHDVTNSTDDAKKQADASVSDMIQRESSKWDRVYGTEDNHSTSGSTKDRTGRQEIGRRPVTSTEPTYNDHVEIGSVIRSQTGVARQLVSVSEGLDGVNDDLEDMKRELTRIQTKAYTCLDGGGGGDLVGGQTAQAFSAIEGLKDVGIYRRKNEWLEEGLKDVDTYRRKNERIDEGLKNADVYTRKNEWLEEGLKDVDMNRTKNEWMKEALKDIDRPTVYRGKNERIEERLKDAGTYRRKNDWIGGGLKEVDSYRGKNEWMEEREGVVRFDDGNRVQETDRYWKGQEALPSYLPGAGRSHIKENDVHVTHLLTLAEPNESYRQTRSLLDDGAVKRERHLGVDRFGRPITQFVSVDGTYSKQSDDRWSGKGGHKKPDGYCYMCEDFGDTNAKWRGTYDEPSSVTHRSHSHTYKSMSAYEEPSNVVPRTHTYKSMSAYDEPTTATQRSHKYKSMSTYDEPSNLIPIPYTHTYSPLSVTDLDQNSHHRSREDLGIYKTPSGVYFYSGDVRSYPDETSLDSDYITRSFVRQTSVPRGFQSQSQSVIVQPPVSQINRSSAGFTSKFLTKVRRRNSLGGRIDTDRYRAQSLTGY